MFRLHTLLIFILAAGSCAKERPVEKVGNADIADQRYAKSLFTDDLNDPKFGLTSGASAAKKWLFKQTIVNTSENASIVFTGFQRQMQLGYFEFDKERLTFYNALSIHGDSATTTDKHIASWPITHSEYRLKESGGRVTNVEEEDPYLSWDKKNFFTVDFEQGTFAVELLSMMGYPKKCFEAHDPRLVDGSSVVSPEHVAFTVAIDYRFNFDECLDFPNVREYFNQEDYMSIEVRMSFKPVRDLAAADYEPYRYEGEFDPLNAKYGYFKTRVEQAHPENIFQNVFLMNRWNPKRDASKPHVIYFDRDFPQEYKWIYNHPEHGVIARTNQIMQRQGLATRFAISDVPEGVQFGDVGVSFIKFVKELSQGAPLGYGPSDANPLTGEIVSANTILWGGMLGNYLKRIQQEVSMKPVRYENSSLFYKMVETLKEDKEYTAEELAAGLYEKSWTHTAPALRADQEAGEAFHFLLPEFTFGYIGNAHAYLGEKGSAYVSDPAKFESFMQANLFNDRVFQQAQDMMSPQIIRPIQDALKGTKAGIRDYFAKEMIDYNNSSLSTVYAMEQSMASAQSALLSGKELKDILNTILYRVAIHEFGHNLGLRHNFYGSVDAKNFRNHAGAHQHSTASVMDYQDLTDEMDEVWDWEAYDEAALTYAYSNGEVDLGRKNKTTFLYCTDEHRLMNAMCAAWDRGTTPSEVALSIINRYEALYYVRNHRFDRPFWYTGGYAAAVFQTMWDLKKFLPMHNQTFGEADVNEALKASKWKALIDSKEIKNRIVEPIRLDLKQANLLASVFYYSMIQQKPTERSWLDEYDDFSGALNIKGILYDKVYAAFFLVGDAMFPYDHNEGMLPLTYTSFFGDGAVGDKIKNIINLTVTEDTSAQQGFESFARALYALNAGSYLNLMTNTSIIDQLRLVCYRPESLKKHMGIDPILADGKPLDAEVLENTVNQAQSPEPYFLNSGARIAVTEIEGNYFVAAEDRNPIAFTMIRKVADHPKNLSRGYKKSEVREFYNYHSQITMGTIPDCL